MITSISQTGTYLRSTPASPKTLTRADALPLPDADASAAAEKAMPGIAVSDVKKLDMSGLQVVSIKDHPELRDRMAMMWLMTQSVRSAAATEVSDDAPQNLYATVKVNGKVVASLYNGGSSVMTNAAAATVGDLQDPPGLIGGPDLAQARAERIAKALGGTIEKASTAITQSEWRPRQSTSTTYTRQQLDAAYEAMMAEQQAAVAQRQTGYSVPQGIYADISA